MRFGGMAAAVWLFGAGSALAAEDDWRFCVAADLNAKIAYLTPVFENDDAHRDLEAKVSALLTEKHLPFQNVQCRLPTDLPESTAERADALAFVKALGMKVEPAP